MIGTIIHIYHSQHRHHIHDDDQVVFLRIQCKCQQNEADHRFPENENEFRYPGVRVTNMSTAWKDGLAFCAIVHRFDLDTIIIAWTFIFMANILFRALCKPSNHCTDLSSL